MDASLKQKWVEALRSGKYKQGKGYLYDDVNDSYCCLGVLCKIQGVEIVPRSKSEYRGDDDKGNDYMSMFDHLFDQGSYQDSKRTWGYLTFLNDHGKSFLDIADHIENVL